MFTHITQQLCEIFEICFSSDKTFISCQRLIKTQINLLARGAEFVISQIIMTDNFTNNKESLNSKTKNNNNEFE